MAAKAEAKGTFEELVSLTDEFLFVRASGEQQGRIAGLVDDGVLRPVVGRTISFAETPEALKGLGEGGIRGKAVLINPPQNPATAPGDAARHTQGQSA